MHFLCNLLWCGCPQVLLYPPITMHDSLVESHQNKLPYWKGKSSTQLNFFVTGVRDKLLTHDNFATTDEALLQLPLPIAPCRHVILSKGSRRCQLDMWESVASSKQSTILICRIFWHLEISALASWTKSKWWTFNRWNLSG